MTTAACAAASSAEISTYIPVLAALVPALIAIVLAWLAHERSIRLEGEKARLAAELETEKVKLATSLEAEKVKLATQTQVLSQLIKARLEAYPHIFTVLSDLWKHPPTMDTAAKSLEMTLKLVNDLDSKYSVIFGPKTDEACFKFRRTLVRALEAASGNSLTPDNYRKWADRLGDRGEDLELALKSDLGIFGLELSGAYGIRPRSQYARDTDA